MPDGLAHARRIADDHRQAFELQPHLDHVARGAGFLRDDGHVAPGQRIQQARLAGVGRPRQHDVKPLAQQLAAVAVIEMLADLAGQRLHLGAGSLDGDDGDVGLIGKIDGGFELRHGADQTLPPSLIEAKQRSARLPQSLPSLRGGFRLDEIRQPLRAGQIELAVLKRAAGELAGLRQAAAFDVPQRRQHALDHGPAAVHLEFRHVLAGLAFRRREPEHQRLVQNFAGAGMLDLPERGEARLGQRRRHPLDRLARRRPRDADDRDARAAVPAGKRKDGVGGAHCWVEH